MTKWPKWGYLKWVSEWVSHQLQCVKEWLHLWSSQQCPWNQSSSPTTAKNEAISPLFFLDNLEDKNDINVLDHIHATAAHDAAEFGQQETLLMLLKHGANISIKDTVSALQLVHVQAQHMLIIIHWGSPNHWVLNLQLFIVQWMGREWMKRIDSSVMLPIETGELERYQM